MRMASRNVGLTLVEVVIALLILVVGVLGALAIQTNSLQGTRTATIDQQVSSIVESELQLQREFDRAIDVTVTGETCRASFDANLYSCAVTVNPCSLASGTITCVSGSASDVVARQVVVTVSGPSGRTLQGTTVVK